MMNLLEQDGEVVYHGKIFTDHEAGAYYQHLLTEIEWRLDEAIMFGKKIITDRKVAWYAYDAIDYTYSKITRQAIKFTDTLLQLKSLVENKTGSTYNSCLMNLYHNGNEGVGWHSDDEKTLEKDASIASVSFGAERNFVFKHKKLPLKASVLLEHGSLCEMKAGVQQNWIHAILKTKKITTPRISLTFRSMIRQ